MYDPDDSRQGSDGLLHTIMPNFSPISEDVSVSDCTRASMLKPHSTRRQRNAECHVHMAGIFRSRRAYGRGRRRQGTVTWTVYEDSDRSRFFGLTTLSGEHHSGKTSIRTAQDSPQPWHYLSLNIR